jgi:hypothetical protein
MIAAIGYLWRGQGVTVNLLFDCEEARGLGIEGHVCELQLLLRDAPFLRVRLAPLPCSALCASVPFVRCAHLHPPTHTLPPSLVTDAQLSFSRLVDRAGISAAPSTCLTDMSLIP